MFNTTETDVRRHRDCPECGHRMTVTNSRNAGRLKRRKYRRCDGCGRRDTLLVIVEQLVGGIRVLHSTRIPDDSPTGDREGPDNV